MVATAAQIAANRANALRSTGPRTPEGKAASSRNALTHGAHASDDTILATSADTYLADFRAHFQPADALEAHLVAHLAVLASRRDRLQVAMDALLELNERHALIEHLHERYGRNNPNAFIDGQPSWQAALRRYDGNTYIDDRFPEPASDPALDPDPILCSLAYTLSGPRAAALFRHEASVDRRFTATLKELTALQTQRRAVAAAEGANPSAGQLYEPTLQRALDRYLRDIAPAPTGPLSAAMAPVAPPSPVSGTRAPTDTAAARAPGSQTLPLDQTQAVRPEHESTARPEQSGSRPAPEQTEPNASATIPTNAERLPDPQPFAAGADHAIRPRPEATQPDQTQSGPAGNQAIAALNLAENEPTRFLSVLPRHPDQPSSIPCDHWSSHSYSYTSP
jgi:hypothetical protein